MMMWEDENEDVRGWEWECEKIINMMIWRGSEIVLCKIDNDVIELYCKDVIPGYKLQTSAKSNVTINNILYVKMYIWQCKTPTYLHPTEDL